ncbi:MAG: GGDEF domain-containing protein [bacterium]|nr:GGDEF domain-containing protein [bacterium]
MSLDKIVRRGIEKEDEERQEITEDEKEDYIEERTEYRNEYDATLETQITADALTGLTNRKGLTNELERVLKAMRQTVEKHRANEQTALEEFSLLYIDLDNFKCLNDALGHTAGDIALNRVAEILKSSIRETEVATRLHGDEFMVFLPRVTEAGAGEVAQKIQEKLSKDLEFKKYEVGASIGLRHISKSDLSEQVTPETLIKEADLQQMKAKQNGKGKIEIHQVQ